ncbi:hypothetical protein QBC43DRAFT_228287, partial [Cladorrhinum sp. PSN259]
MDWLAVLLEMMLIVCRLVSLKLSLEAQGFYLRESKSLHPETATSSSPSRIDRRARWKGQMTNFESLAEYVSHTLEARDVDAYVRLSEGSLTLRAPFLPVMKVLPKKEKKNELNDSFRLPPSFSEIADSVYQLRLGDGKKIWIEGGWIMPLLRWLIPNRYLCCFSCLPFLLEDGFLEHRLGLLVKGLDGEVFEKIGFVDGVTLRETGIFSEKLEVIGHPLHSTDVDEDFERQILAVDPFPFKRLEVAI